MEKSKLEAMIKKGKSTYAIAKEIGKGQTTVRYWLKKYGLSTRLNRSNPSYLCKYCGETEKGRRCKCRCKKCHSKKTNERQSRNRLFAVKYKNGKCIRCGYSKCIHALDFHHRDPSEKDAEWGTMRNWSKERLIKEIDKCDLLCCRCHREKHAGLW